MILQLEIFKDIWGIFEDFFQQMKFKYDLRYVPFDERSLLEKRGWTRDGDSYIGHYRTRYGAWKGSIRRRADKWDVFIFNPPKEKLKNHSRWVCFYHQGSKKYRINLALAPKDKNVDSIIFYVEKIIYESFEHF